jgi:serine/threonine protein phosphatase 1
MPRTIAIGDIHGCSIALAELLKTIAPQPDDTVVPLGDYVDRGIDSRGVIAQLISLADRCRLVPILGNHEEMMLGARQGRSDFRFWMNCGGIACLDSYGATGRMDLIPREHFTFLQSCRTYFETERHFFVHANYKPKIPLERQTLHTLRWLSLRDYVPPSPHCSGKIAVVGHTPHYEILDLGYLKCLDTGCCNGGWLTALDVDSGQVWQVSEQGQLRGT